MTRWREPLVEIVSKAKLIKPIKLSNRTKVQIVHDTEKLLGHVIIPAVMPWHSLGDR